MKTGRKLISAIVMAMALAGCGSQETAVVSEIEEIQTPVEKTIPVEISRTSGGYGIPAEMYYNLQKELDQYPYSGKMEIKTMPVYKRNANPAGEPYGLSVQQIHNIMLYVTERAGLEVTDYSVEFAGKDHPEGISEMAPRRITAETDDAYISADAFGCVSIWFKPGKHVKMPEELDFELDADDSEANEAIAYLDKQYGSMLEETAHGYDLGGDYTFDGEKLRRYRIYGISDNNAQTIVNYSFNTLCFYPDDDENLSGILFNSSLSSAEKIGDYPVLEYQEAYDRLYAGDYYSGTGIPVTAKTKVEGSTLIYHNDHTTEYQMPYYRFWIDITEDLGGKSTDKLRTYGVYDVPAVRPEYLDENDNPVTAASGEKETYPDAKKIKLTRFVQENSWYCGPACGQMILGCFGIKADQKTLAAQMNTYNPGDRKDGIIGTFDYDVARVLNEYLFGGQPKKSSDAGYRVQMLGGQYADNEYDTMLKRVMQNIDDGYPSILQVQPYILYGSGSKGNNNVVVCGYQKKGKDDWLIIADPYYEGEGGGFSMLKAKDIYEAVVYSDEPSYIW